MKRRKFLYGGLTGLVSFPAISKQGIGNASVLEPSKKLIVCFRSGTAESMAEDGSWNICVLADPRNSQRPDAIRLKFQVAVDEAFNDVIHEERCFARKNSSYLLYVNYKPIDPPEELHYRFIALDVKRRDQGRSDAPEYEATPIKRLRRPS